MHMNKINRLLIFDIYGPVAHFRKYHTNSSSLSYVFPPRTVITGIIAGFLGWEKDSYYETLSPSQSAVSVQILGHPRKIFQTVNYLFVISPSDLNGRSGHTQIPLELVVPALGEREVRYRIYFAHQDEAMMEELAQKLEMGTYHYPPYLGLSEFMASVESIATKQVVIERVNPGELVELCTPVNCSALEERGLLFEMLEGETPLQLQYIKERMPLFFLPERRPGGVADFILEKNQRVTKVRLRDYAWKVIYHNREETIAFMEAEDI